jgi:uncharacterized protein with FMN-binding domain
MVALSASAIASIYAAGFMLTRSADAGLASSATSGAATAAPAVSTATTQPASASTPTPVVGASAPVATAPVATPAPAASPTAAPSPTAASSTSTAATASAYKDGTFTGSGTSRRGGIGVSVTIQSGTITNVQITAVSTQYPVSRIASLPATVVKQQTANVNVISGATYSSQAFKQAVQQALSVAQATNGPVTG